MLHYIGIGMFPVSIAINAICCIISFAIYTKQKSIYKNWNGENEDVLDSIDQKLSFPVNISSAIVIVNYLFFAINIYMSLFGDLSKKMSSLFFLGGTVLFILGLVWTTTLQGITVKLVKEINPEKKGNILDTSFRKNWVDSCDEFEKNIIYKSSYDAFIVGNGTCMVLWIVALFGMLIFNTGIFAVILVSILWLVLSLAYMIAASKYEKGSK